MHIKVIISLESSSLLTVQPTKRERETHRNKEFERIWAAVVKRVVTILIITRILIFENL